MKRLFLLTLLFLFTSASAEILTIWDDVDNMDGSRPGPAEVIYRMNGEIIDPDNPPDDWQSITADTVPGYTVTGPLHQNSHIIFIHRHKPELKSRSVTNELQYSTLSITMKVTDPGPGEEFRVRLKFRPPGTYRCMIGETEYDVTDGSVLNLQAGQTARLTLPIGTRWSVEQEEKVRYKTTVAVDTGEPRTDYTASGEIENTETTVTYNNIPLTTSFSVTKRWDGAVGQRITLHLLANGEPIESGFFQVNNRYTAENLPLYDYSGKPIIYTATEEYMEGYLTAYVNYGMYAGETRFLYSGGTVINREVAEFRVYKEWVGIDEEPPEISLHLYDKDTELPAEPIMRDNWYIWKLPIAFNDRIPEYYVLEEPMRGFMTEYLHNGELADRARNGDTIRNTTVPPTGERHPLLFWIIVLVSAGLGFMVSRRRK